MTPWQLAQQWHNAHDSTRSFAELVGEYLGSASILSTPQLFVLAKEIRWNAEEQQFEDGSPNCWFVHLAAAVGHANPVGEFLRIAPHPHEYAGWCRRNSFEPKVYRWEKLINKRR
jgi:hypothetical protein